MFDQAKADRICARLMAGESLRKAAREEGISDPTFLLWVSERPALAEQYARAREAGADAIFDALDDVSDQAVNAESAVTVQGLRLKADNIKWKLARMAPKKYGDKLDVNHSGNFNVTLTPTENLL